MKSLEYSLINSGKEPLRQSLEMLYDDSNINKLGGLTRNQEMFIIKLIEDHKNLNKERSIISKKYNEAVDANFQLYQQNEMLKAQNISLLEKNKDLVNEELMINTFQIRDFNKFPFSSNEQKIISHFTNEHNDKFNDNLSQLQIPQELKKNIITNNLHDEKVILTDNNMKEKCNHIGKS
ncbi:hypothetical protein C923_00316 [Plasmodium falciparum UGT5.1]|uniref:Uncharacterized protein n=1 Tax=Plasmodium falciparum UGT5.1 TaxID=1237627 RepID=W7JW17_PLAFA|nr:hypothetical protein C923_00316 [Plasmodium falciparum UGT5.1]